MVEYIEQDFVWKDVNHRCTVCTPVTQALAYPTELQVSFPSTRPEKPKDALSAEIFTLFV